ncbi:MAG: lasso peptide biosynthesis B2 protein [Gemmatimonadota bacterium]|nr:lasso peptide biosynthesis B2 protein [Gemmatimonadota bacterium]
MIRQLILFVRLPAPERRDLVEAAALCTVAGVLIRVLKFRRLAPRLGRHMAVSPAERDEATSPQVAGVRWAIEAAARHLPWRPVCLPQAVAAQWMLRRRGIPSTLYLGADPARAYDAHAWVRAGTTIVTGGPLEERFTVVSSFA